MVVLCANRFNVHTAGNSCRALGRPMATENLEPVMMHPGPGADSGACANDFELVDSSIGNRAAQRFFPKVAQRMAWITPRLGLLSCEMKKPSDTRLVAIQVIPAGIDGCRRRREMTGRHDSPVDSLPGSTGT